MVGCAIAQPTILYYLKDLLLILLPEKYHGGRYAPDRHQYQGKRGEHYGQFENSHDEGHIGKDLYQLVLSLFYLQETQA